MKILLVHNSYQQPGGEDVVFKQECQLLEQAGHEVVTYERSNWEINSYSGVKRVALVGRAIWADDTRRDFAALLRLHRPALAHVHNTFFMISPSIYAACREAGVPVVQTLHNYRLFCPAGTFFRNGHVCEECLEHGLQRSMFYGCYRNSRATTAAMALTLAVHRRLHTWSRAVTCFIALSEFSKNKFLQGGMPGEKIFVKPNFVHPDPRSRNTYGGGDYVLFAGRLSPEKRVSTLLAAWKLLRDRIPLVIVGGGPDRHVLEVTRRQGDLQHVEFRGQLPRDQTLAAINGARLLVFSSEWYENFPVTIAEAFACGVPVICSRLGAMQEIVADGRTGLHFKPGDPEDLAQKVDWAWNHPERIGEMGKEARQEYETKYTAAKNYPLLMEIYQRAIAHHE